MNDDPQTNGLTDPQINRTTDQRTHRTTDPPINGSTDPQNNRSTSVGRAMTITLPDRMYEAIHNRAGKLGVRKKEIIVGLIQGGAREEINFKQVIKELDLLMRIKLFQVEEPELTHEELQRRVENYGRTNRD